MQAARIMLERIDALVNRQESFAIETTLSTRSYKGLVAHAQKVGYKVTLIFFWLRSAELAKQRVAKRVSLGGHNIPEESIERRYSRGIANLLNDFVNLCDVWMLYDNSDITPVLIAKGADRRELEIVQTETFELIKKYAK